MSKWFFLLVGIVIVAVVWQTRFAQNGGGVKLSNPMTGEPIGKKVQAPGFEGGGEWLHSEPLVLSDLVGPEATGSETKAVLVDFWTYSCINCQRTIPYLRQWWDEYKDKGLVIVGVHTPEFDFEKEVDNLAAASDKYGVTWPVVQDNDYKIWDAYENRFWPRKYLVNSEGEIVYDHIGEGGYEETERQIQKLLGISGEEVVAEPTTNRMPFGMELTPELYVTKRGKDSGQIGKGKNKVELIGNWEVSEDYAQAGEGAELRLPFQAGEMNLVMSLPDEVSRNVVVVVDEGKEETVEIAGDDLYPLWQGGLGEHVLEMRVDEGVRLHAFTFGG